MNVEYTRTLIAVCAVVISASIFARYSVRAQKNVDLARTSCSVMVLILLATAGRQMWRPLISVQATLFVVGAVWFSWRAYVELTHGER